MPLKKLLVLTTRLDKSVIKMYQQSHFQSIEQTSLVTKDKIYPPEENCMEMVKEFHNCEKAKHRFLESSCFVCCRADESNRFLSFTASKQKGQSISLRERNSEVEFDPACPCLAVAERLRLILHTRGKCYCCFKANDSRMAINLCTSIQIYKGTWKKLRRL